jgi:hypothetical protein
MALRDLADWSCLLKNFDPGTLVPEEILEQLKVHHELVHTEVVRVMVLHSQA